jgi:hypothetical protein
MHVRPDLIRNKRCLQICTRAQFSRKQAAISLVIKEIVHIQHNKWINVGTIPMHGHFNIQISLMHATSSNGQLSRVHSIF